MSINSSSSDFAPSFHNESLLFASARDTGLGAKRIHKWNMSRFLDVYLASGDEVTKLSKKINSKYHESTTCLSKDGNELYFTRNNYSNKKYLVDKKGINRLKIYKSIRDINGVWQKPIELPFNGNQYSTAHPSLNYEENRLYFASDREGTFGKSDIYYVDINKDGKYGVPINLGANINTESRETFPFVSKKDILYFSTDGHPGLGGLDIHAVNLSNIEKGKVVNIGGPVNSPYDDFSYISDSDKKIGYFASNRPGGKGNDDIYSFKELKPLDFKSYTKLQGVLTENKEQAPIAAAKLNLFRNGVLVDSIFTDRSGRYSFEKLDDSASYNLEVAKLGYKKVFMPVTLEHLAKQKTLNLSFEEEEDLAKLLPLNPIYFNFDASYISKRAKPEIDKIVAYMKENPNVKIEIRSYTDSRGKASYNLYLSEKRAKATAAYLIKEKIASDRIQYKGYGEGKIINKCIDGVVCNKEKHSLNRRSEFIIL